MTPHHETPGHKATFWSTVTAAVHGGWGPTLRLLSIFALLALLVAGTSALTGGNEIEMLRGLLA